MSVDPGEGYRLLRDGEVCRDGDEFLLNNGWRAVDADCDVGHKYDNDWAPTRRKTTAAEADLQKSLNRIRTSMQNHPNWAAILFGELTEPLRTDLKLVLEHYLGQ